MLNVLGYLDRAPVFLPSPDDATFPQRAGDAIARSHSNNAAFDAADDSLMNGLGSPLARDRDRVLEACAIGAIAP
jgi:hypothetical protein